MPSDRAAPPCRTCNPVHPDSHPGVAAEPCCDDRCLEEIALQLCDLQCRNRRSLENNPGTGENASCGRPGPSGPIPVVPNIPAEAAYSSSPPQSRKRKREACIAHSRSVRERYGTVLAKFGCICEALLVRQLVPCCKQRQPAESQSPALHLQNHAQSYSLPQPSGDEDCCGRTTRCGCDKLSAQKDETEIRESECGKRLREAQEGSCGSDLKLDCCHRSEVSDQHVAESDMCCGSEDTGSASKRPNCDCMKSNCSVKDQEGSCYADEVGSTCAAKCTAAVGGSTPPKCAPRDSQAEQGSQDDCCSNPRVVKEPSMPIKPVDQTAIGNSDIEKSLLNLGHVILDVQGLTCTGCETKLFRSLEGLPGIYNVQTSLVLSRAEFDIDEKLGPVDDVVKSVERATGFPCQRVNQEGQEIDVLVSGDAKVFIDQKYPNGVLQMTAIGKQMVRILYDGRIVGARTLLNESFSTPLRLAAQRASSEIESGRAHLRNMAWTTCASMVLTIPVLVMAWASLPPHPIAYGGASLGLATIVQFLIAGPFYPSALRALVFTRVMEVDLLIVLSTTTAYIFSVVSFAYMLAGRPLSTGQFFQTSTLLITLIVLGRLVSAFARQRAVESISIRSLQAETATLYDINGVHDEPIDVRLLQYGDHFKVMPDSRIPTDGQVVSGSTEVDESMVTGESIPVEKYSGSSVIAGSLNGSGTIVVRLTHLPGDNTISTIATMVDRAKFSKARTQELVDIVAGYFAPMVLVLTIITFGVWMAVGIAVRHQKGGAAAVNALTYSLSALVVSCPCAIGLAVPMVIVIAGGVAAKHGVIFKSATTVETARKVSHVVFDKTGTLTQGQLSVVEELYFADEHDIAASVALGLTCDSKHPVSVGVAAHLKAKDVHAARIENAKSITGKGVQGMLDRQMVRCGNTRWLAIDERPEIRHLLTKGFTVFAVTMNEEPIAAFGLSDSLRPDSHFVVSELQKRHTAVSIISGDDAGAVEAIAAQLNVPASHTRARCTPGDKQEYLKQLKTHGAETVLFCGDGTNDAIALAQADIGVHINTGSDVAQNAADVVLMRPYLSGLLVLLDLSQAAFRRILFNFVWAFVYNLFAILLAAGAFVNVRIEPQYAGLGEIVSVLPVILIALQLKLFKRRF